MIVALMRHGQYARSVTGEDVGLTTEGRQQVWQVGEQLKVRCTFHAIWHSGRLRAQQTAQQLFQLLNCDVMTERTGLHPDSDPAAFVCVLECLSDNILIVSHLPFLGFLHHSLTGELRDFQPAECYFVERTQDGRWRSAGHLRP